MKIRLWIWFALAACISASANAAGNVKVEWKVVDTKGSPVAGITVYALPITPSNMFTPSIQGTAKTGLDGSFECPVAYTEGDNTVAIFAVAYTPDTWLGWSIFNPGWSPDSLERKDSKVIIVVAKPRVYRGRVTDASGAPISGAVVRHGWFVQGDALDQPCPEEIISAVVKLDPSTTDLDGNFALSNVPGNSELFPSVSKAGYAVRISADQKPSSMITLVQGGAITGRVVDGNGEGISGVVMLAITKGNALPYRTITRASGAFTLEGVMPETYEIALFPHSDDAIIRHSSDIKVKAGKTTTLPVVSLARAYISGKVVDARTGKPIPGAKLGSSSATFDGGEAVSDAQGNYKLPALPGKVTIEYKGGNAGYGSDVPVAPDSVNVPATGLKGFDLKLDNGNTASGTVVGLNGKPVAGAIVGIGQRNQGIRPIADAKGRFRITVPSLNEVRGPANCGCEDMKGFPADMNTGCTCGCQGISGDDGSDVTLFARDPKTGYGVYQTIDRKKLLVHGITLKLQEPQSLTVDVVGKDGKPLSGAGVTVSTRDKACNPPKATTGVNGKVQIAGIFPGGAYEIEVKCNGYDDYTEDYHQVGSKDWKPLRKITLSHPIFGKGRVVDKDGKPISGAKVNVVDSESSSKSGPDGSFRIKIPSGNKANQWVTLQIVNPTHDLGYEAHVTQKTLVSDGMTITLLPLRKLTVVVKDKAGNLLSDVKVTVGCAEAKSTGNPGQYVVTDIYPGEGYSIQASKDGFIYQPSNDGQTLDPGSDQWPERVEIVMESANRVQQGLVVDESGKPVAGAQVWFYGGWNQTQTATTDMDGTFTLKNLPDSPVTINASKGNARGTATVNKFTPSVTIELQNNGRRSQR
jgi:hypothetical protein